MAAGEAENPVENTKDDAMAESMTDDELYAIAIMLGWEDDGMSGRLIERLDSYYLARMGAEYTHTMKLYAEYGVRNNSHRLLGVAWAKAYLEQEDERKRIERQMEL